MRRTAAMAITADQLMIRRLTPPQPVRYFTRCLVRFDGTRTSEAVEDFVAFADFFKCSEDISDERAVKGILLLLEGSAYTWWTDVKDSITTWARTQTAIRNELAPSPPAYKIYLEVFFLAQQDAAPTGLSVAHIEPVDSKAHQINIYGLLRREIREKVSRVTVATFTALLNVAREGESTLQETPKEAAKVQSSSCLKGRSKCTYSRNVGHDVSVCRKKARADAEDASRTRTSSEVGCYECDIPRVFHRDCPNCKILAQNGIP